MGIGSRSEIKKYLKTCRVKLNGKFEKNSNTQVDIEKDEILFDDEIVIYKEFTYLMLNKPKDFISATFDTKLPTVLDLLEFPYSNMELFPVGRLDIDTTGFLILTNDGKFSYNVTNPKKKVNKKYFVTLRDEIISEQIEKLENGIRALNSNMEGAEGVYHNTVIVLSIKSNTSPSELLSFFISVPIDFNAKPSFANVPMD